MIVELLIGFSCLSRRPAISESPLTRLRTAEIRAFLMGSTISRDNPSDSVSRTDSAEQFLVDGSYVRISDRSQSYGTYKIADDEVCVEAENSESSCRQLFVDTHGNPWLRDARSESDRLERYSRIEER